MRCTILHATHGPFQFQTRIEKELESAREYLKQQHPDGTQVVLARESENLPSSEAREYYRVRRVSAKKLKIFGSKVGSATVFFSLIITMGLHILRLRPKVLVLHSWPMLPLAVFGRLVSARVVYDAHEFESGQFSGRDRWRNWIVRFVERTFLVFVHHMMVVSPSILERYKERFPRQAISLVINFPPTDRIAPTVSSATELSTRRRAIYTGVFSAERAVDVLLQVALNKSDCDFFFVGHGPLADQIASCSQSTENVEFVETLPIPELVAFLDSVDIGFALLDPSIENNRYALPNKFFMYANRGLSIVLEQNSIDMIQIAAEHGVVSAPCELNVESICRALDTLPKRNHTQTGKFSWISQNDVIARAFGLC